MLVTGDRITRLQQIEPVKFHLPDERVFDAEMATYSEPFEVTLQPFPAAVDGGGFFQMAAAPGPDAGGNIDASTCREVSHSAGVFRHNGGDREGLFRRRTRRAPNLNGSCARLRRGNHSLSATSRRKVPFKCSILPEKCVWLVEIRSTSGPIS